MKVLQELEQLLQALTPREREVLGLAAKGLPHKQIARQLGIGRRTVQNHIVSIYDKLCPVRRKLIVAIIQGWRRGEIAFPEIAPTRTNFQEW